jgi:hypothetical protein
MCRRWLFIFYATLIDFNFHNAIIGYVKIYKIFFDIFSHDREAIFGGDSDEDVLVRFVTCKYDALELQIR